MKFVQRCKRIFKMLRYVHFWLIGKSQSLILTSEALQKAFLISGKRNSQDKAEKNKKNIYCCLLPNPGVIRQSHMLKNAKKFTVF
jgi:hypothetical protein